MEPEQDLARRFSVVAQQLSSDGMTRGLQQAVDLASQMVPGCDYAGITLIQPGKVFTPAATEGPAVNIDQLQYDLGEGPCLDTAARDDVGWLLIDNVDAEKRWPRFARGAQELGVGSVLSCDLDGPRGMLGALNLYATTPGSFDADARETAFIYAAHAGVALSAQRLQDSLGAAMESRESIGIAMGILMERHKATRSHVFDMLVQVSQDTNTKLRDLAERVALTGEEPH